MIEGTMNSPKFSDYGAVSTQKELGFSLSFSLSDMLNGLVDLDMLEEFLKVILFWKKRALMAYCSSKMECCHIFTLQFIVSWIDSFHRSDLAEVPLSI